MNAAADQDILVADADTRAIAEGLEPEGLRAPVAQHLDHLEADLHPDAVAVGIDGRKVTQDSTTDLVAFRIDRDSLAHLERRIGIHRDVADEGGDLLFGQGLGGEAEEEAEGQQQGAHGVYFLKSTFGTSRSAGSPISKNSDFSNLK